MQENTILIKVSIRRFYVIFTQRIQTVQRLKERANVLRQEKQHVELSLTQAQGDHERVRCSLAVAMGYVLHVSCQDMEKLYQETICGICLDPWCEPHMYVVNTVDVYVR